MNIGKAIMKIKKQFMNIGNDLRILENNHGFPKFLNAFSIFIIILQYWKIIMNIHVITNIGKNNYEHCIL